MSGVETRSKWQRRLDCHGTRWCCQYQDQPNCNTARDPHLVARVRWRLVHRWRTWVEEH